MTITSRWFTLDVNFNLNLVTSSILNSIRHRDNIELGILELEIEFEFKSKPPERSAHLHVGATFARRGCGCIPHIPATVTAAILRRRDRSRPTRRPQECCTVLGAHTSQMHSPLLQQASTTSKTRCLFIEQDAPPQHGLEYLQSIHRTGVVRLM